MVPHNWLVQKLFDVNIVLFTTMLKKLLYLDKKKNIFMD